MASASSFRCLSSLSTAYNEILENNDVTATGAKQRNVATVDLSTVSMGYETDGTAEGTPLFLLHGFPDTAATWDGVVDHLPTGELFIVRPHIRGHGLTRVHPGRTVSAETAALATDVIELADNLGLDSFHIVGSDWGCRAAYALAGLAPGRVRSMVTLGTGYNEATPISDLSLDQVSSFWYQWLFQTEHGRELLQDNRGEFCRHLGKKWSPAWEFGDQEFAEVATAIENDQFVDTVLHYYRYRWRNAPITEQYENAQRLVDSMPAITVRTTHIQGLEDHCTRPDTARQWETRVTGEYRRVDLAGIGHFPQREVPERVAAEILRTIRGEAS